MIKSYVCDLCKEEMTEIHTKVINQHDNEIIHVFIAIAREDDGVKPFMYDNHYHICTVCNNALNDHLGGWVEARRK